MTEHELTILPQASPPPYPGPDVLSQSPGHPSSDFGVDPMDEEDGE